MATQAQYDAAKAALRALAEAKIAQLPFFEQGAAEKALNDTLLEEFARAAVDASERARGT